MVFGRPHATAGHNLFCQPVPSTHIHICGLYYIDPRRYLQTTRQYLPTLSQSVHARIIASTSRTTLTQTFINPSPTEPTPELRYTFPLYDGVSVVAFTCTINNDRVIRGVVQEKTAARNTYNQAVAKGQTAGLLEQLPDASDVFTTTIGNVPAGAEIAIDIEYLGELKHDAEVDGIRFTIPTSVAPRYGAFPGELLAKPTNVSAKDGIRIVVDAEVPTGSVIKSIQSPSHPISVSVGSTSTMNANATPSLQLASATLSLGTAQLDNDFIIQIIATNTSNPVAVLETHPTIPHQQALMATLVPKFKLAATKPEVVFICDRSGSMEGNKMEDLKNALRIFMKSLPVGSMFNICSFGSRHDFLFPKSVMYDQSTLETAMRHIDTFSANYGGTQIYNPIETTFKRRHIDLDLETFVLTDGEVWDQGRLFGMVDRMTQESKGAIRLFTLGVGKDVSHSLIEGLARAGNGFSQSVSENEKMSGKVVRMLKGALTPHVNDYTLEVKYADAESETEPEDDFDIIEPEDAVRGKTTDIKEPEKPISLFDNSADDDVDMEDAQPRGDNSGLERYSHIPTVKPPKILQAPFQIPPLFPFSRTSVYLLLSPDRELRSKTPESLVLRGTSSQGPLELRIPITVLDQKAKTIHQLAARKAVKELEEGCGWIYHAKGRDGNLLQTQHPGRFPSMVEREAVRLSIQFQVGGKWCSFVAVEQNNTRNIEQTGTANPKQAKSGTSKPDLTRQSHAVMKKARGGMVSRSQKRSTGMEDFSSMAFADPLVRGNVLNDFDFDSYLNEDGSNTIPQGPVASAFGMPSSTASSNLHVPFTGSGLFGGLGSSNSQQQQQQQRAAPRSFGSGQPGGSLFGQPTAHSPSSTSAAGGLFGSRSPSTGAFGAAPSPASHTGGGIQLFGGSGGGLFGHPAAPTAPAPSSTPNVGGLFGSCSFGAAPARKEATGSQLFGGNGSHGGLFGQPQAANSISPKPQSGGLFGSASPPPQWSDGQPPIVQAAALAPPTTQVDAALLDQYQREMDEATCMSIHGEISDDDWENEASPAAVPAVAATVDLSMKKRCKKGISSPFVVPPGFGIVPPPPDKFSTIVSLQNFDGSWDSSKKLFDIIGITLEVVKEALYRLDVDEERVMSTSVVIAFLRQVLTKERDSWEMLEEKAVTWLEGELGEETAQKVLAIAERLF
ncbi:von Willebrand factor type A domain-containing protein [Colletotrichum godetiae]|uniref:von Willebrand factor type A domain-containing protein n=1 Tax=Colletotrichum godetiae TaxID=1209918 RepID=A0AAJ0EM97_9PEZI|nr:von Willebrand factor type A domain-containing protein [Colletotrichum godetiae]KAK1658440.1 von Willebrand factor type A domain-containing protein [Colletotrichum godetiae]